VAATVTEGVAPAYQWHSNISNSNIGGTVVDGATGATFAIPTSLTAGTYYYFCEVGATGAVPVRSNVATVTVAGDIPAVVDRISLTGWNQLNYADYVVIRLYSDAAMTKLVAKAETLVSSGNSSDGILLDPSDSGSGPLILTDLPTNVGYYICVIETWTIWDESTDLYIVQEPLRQWESLREINIGLPIVYDSMNYRYRNFKN
jgi:hypothetical protein